jgi:hypothetical protein
VKLIFALFVLAIGVYYGNHNYKLLMDKTAQQEQHIQTLSNWKHDYNRLSSIITRWDKLPRKSSLRDILSIVEYLKLTEIHLHTNIDKTSIAKIDPLTVNGVALGAELFCLTNNGGDRTALFADDYETLLKGVNTLSYRDDVSFDGVSIESTEEGIAIANISNLCIVITQ